MLESWRWRLKEGTECGVGISTEISRTVHCLAALFLTTAHVVSRLESIFEALSEGAPCGAKDLYETSSLGDVPFEDFIIGFLSTLSAAIINRTVDPPFIHLAPSNSLLSRPQLP